MKYLDGQPQDRGTIGAMRLCAAGYSVGVDGIIIETTYPTVYFCITSLLEANPMLAKLTYKNQITLPKSVLTHCQGTEYFDVSEDNGRIVLTPVRLNKADAVRSKLADMGISEDDVTDAVNWAREPKRMAKGS